MPFAPERLGAEVRLRFERVFCASVALFTTAGLLIPTGFAKAQIVNDLINYIKLALAYVLGWLIQFIGNLILLLVEAIISVAQYNHFVNARPVEAGWPLVRDVVNMFFIVVLLVTAFSTIIQYKKFQYRAILPKLLLMAVLVNFSKTLIGLLIDFSQILMLTFVNGFKAAAAGNFVTALKLDKILQLSQQRPNTEESDTMLTKLLMAEFLGLFFVGTTVVMLLIMLVYLLVRIVGLWIALIMSPAAFFASALESTPLSRGIAFITGSFWPKLGALLSGGPIMAFFLWLTLATAQSGGFSDIKAASQNAAQRGESEEAIGYFSSAVGNSEEVATYFVAIIMLLMGVEAAVSISGQVSSQLGQAAGSIQRTGMSATRFMTYGAAAGAAAWSVRQAGRGVAAGARGTGRYIDSRANITGKLGSAVQGVASFTGSATIGQVGAKLRGVRAGERNRVIKEMEAATTNMSVGERMKALESYTSDSKLANKDKQRAANIMLAKLQASKDGMGAMNERFTEEGKEKGLGGDILKGYAEKQTRTKAAERLTELETLAKETNDQDLLKYVREEYEKRPDLVADTESIKSKVNSIMDDGDIKDLAKKIDSRAFRDTNVMDAIIQNSGMLRGDGTVDESNLWYKSFIEKGGERGRLFEQRIQDLTVAAGPGGNIAAAISSGAAAGMYVEGGKDKQGRKIYSFVSETALAGASNAEKAKGAGTQRSPRDAEIRAGKDKLERLRSSGAEASKIQGVQQSMMKAGGSLSEIYQIDNNGSFKSEGERANFEVNIHNAIEGAKGGEFEVIQNMNMSVLDENSSGKNDARSAFVKQANIEDLGKAWVAADMRRNPGARKAVANAVRVIDSEGSRVQQTIDRHNAKELIVSKVSPSELVEDYQKSKASGDTAEFQKRLDSLKLEGLDIGMDEVDAMLKKQQLEKDVLLRTYKTHASGHTTVAAKRAKAKAGRAAAKAGRATEVFTTERRAERMDERLTRKANRMELEGQDFPTIEPPPTPPGTPPPSNS